MVVKNMSHWLKRSRLQSLHRPLHPLLQPIAYTNKWQAHMAFANAQGFKGKLNTFRLAFGNSKLSLRSLFNKNKQNKG